MRAAIYARVSTANNGQDPTMQTRELREYCDRRGWDVVGEYVDTASGAKDSRPELNRLLTVFTGGNAMRCSYGSWIGGGAHLDIL